jgi:16S rRNA (uracil1498-N3)-methyltransferase
MVGGRRPTSGMRVLVEPGSGEPGTRIRLDETEIHHLKVRRAKDGEQVEVLDGEGLRGSGILVHTARHWSVEITAAELQPAPLALTLGVAAGDRERFSWMIEKCVELGVTRIVPLESERTAGVATRLKPAHLGRLRRASLEATKQCGATWAPRVEDPVTLAEFAGDPLDGSGWLADQGGDPPPATMDQSGVTVIVGPEGGFTDAEREMAVTHGFRPITLGRHTLRFETAALAAAAAVTQARMRGEHG